MENANYGRELKVPPPPCKPLTEEVEFQNCSGQTVQSTVVTIVPDGPPVRDHIIWSVFNSMYLNCCCLGLLAFVFSIKSRDRKLHGDKTAARSYGSTARSLNIAATVLSILSLVILITIYIISLEQIYESARQFRQTENNLYGK